MKNNLINHEEICRGSTAAVLSEFEPSDVAALEALRATGIDVLEAALVAKTALEAVQGAGEEEGAEHHAAGVRGVSAGAFGTPRQRNKARLILSGVFNTAIRCGWCEENPVRQEKPERVEEKRISILCGEEGARLMSAAEEYKGGSCLAATAIMLYAGVRPNEATRLRWKNVRLDAGVISISPQHSKTGGARCVTIHSPLARILRHAQKADHERICPPNWRQHWAALHRSAGFSPTGNRMCCNTPLLRIPSPPSVATPSCSWKWGTALLPFSARAMWLWRALLFRKEESLLTGRATDIGTSVPSKLGRERRSEK